MRRLRDLSYRIKVPLAMSAVIVIVSAIMAAVLGARIYANARSDLLASAESLGRTLARALTPAMLRDDVWQAYETIVAPLSGDDSSGSSRRSITVIDADGKIYASSDPKRFPMLAPATQASRRTTAQCQSVGSVNTCPFYHNRIPSHSAYPADKRGEAIPPTRVVASWPAPA